MKFQIERAALLSCLAHIQSVVERRATIPILQNVRLEASRGALHLTATDMDMEIAERTPAAIATPGAITVNAHTLYDIARKLPEGAQVEFTAKDGGGVTLAAGRSRFTLPSLPAEDYPAMTGGTFSHTFEVAATALRALIDQSKFAISTEETRYYLNGIYLHTAKTTDGPTLRAVATDGHRLARVEILAPPGSAGMPGVIVPRKAVIEIRKLIDTADGDISVLVSDAKIKVAFGEVDLTSKLIDGTFPDYERVIPQGNDKVLEIAREDLADAVDRVSAIATEKTRAIKVAIEKGLVTLSATADGGDGAASEEVEGRYDGRFVEVGFNHRYLLEVLGIITGPTARLAVADEASPVVLTAPENESALFVLMPMRV